MTIEIKRTILNVKKDSVEKVINRISKRAVKLGLSPVEYEYSDTFYKKIVDEYGRTLHFSMVDITIKMVDEIMIEGEWVLAATLEKTESGIIVNKVDDSIGEFGNIEKIECDHCNTNHQRKYGYAIKNIKNDKVLILGKACLQKYFPASEQLKQALFSASFITLFDDCYDENDFIGGGSYTCYSLEEVLSATVYIVNKYGYKKSNSEGSTSFVIGDMFHEYYAKYDKEISEIIKGQLTEAKEIIEYFKNIDANNDYMNNLKIIANDCCVDFRRHLGYAVSMVATYNKIMEKQSEYEKKNIVNEYFGEIKKRYDFDLTVKRVNSFETEYGTKFIYTMNDSDGRIFVWFTMNDWYECGDEINCRATIKEHKDYKGLKQTIVTRLTENK